MKPSTKLLLHFSLLLVALIATSVALGIGIGVGVALNR